MPQKIEFVITADGKCYRHDTTTRELNLDGLTTRLSGNAITRIYGLTDIPRWGVVSMATQGTNHYFTIKLDKLILKCPITSAEGNGVITPDFTLDADLPVVTLEWNPNPDWRMSMHLLIKVMNRDELKEFVMMWLVTSDKDGRHYKLPLPNLHDDLHICTGNFNGTAPTLIDVVRNALANFEASRWNDHLWNEPEYTQKLFRWDTLEQGFSVNYGGVVDSPFQYCKKAAIAATNYLVI